MLLFIGMGKADRGDTLHCARCGQLIARADALCRILERPPRRSYVNPHGVVCPIVTLADARGLAADSYSSTEHSWFPGYAWRPVACAGCGLFLGWAFEAQGDARPGTFFGLLEDRLEAHDDPV